MLRTIPLLLEGPPREFWRVEGHAWTSWKIFEDATKNSYLDNFHSDKVADEIRARLQKPNEPVGDYIDATQRLYNKMPAPPSKKELSEYTKI